jgi:Zn-dependent peptidase ImmA (M78 family)
MKSLVTNDIDVIAELRKLMPRRGITWSEAYSVAERQAARLLELMQVAEPPVPMFVVSSLAGITVDRRADWPTSGMAVAHDGNWRIVLCADEPRQRQRYSLAHELKHVLDAPFDDQLYGHLSPTKRKQRAEMLCNHFAACLMMPRAWFKRDFCHGYQTPTKLARRYYMSQEAATRRLAELGLAPVRDHLLPEAVHPAPWSTA